ncbi:MAG: rod shape-determining protein MreC [Gammaproteobacteria bacterium]|nr:rod shape-determining protein MreC [Gammaproteobacteria bacterium]
MGTFLGWSIKRPSNFTKFVALAAVSVALIIADARHRHVATAVDGLLARAAYPLQVLAAWPATTAATVWHDITTNAHLRRENDHLTRENRLLRARLTRLGALTAEVQRLRKILKAPPLPGYRETLAGILGVSSGPFTRQLTLDEGRRQHVYVGQAVIDAHGIVGQVIQVGPDISRVMLVTDPNSGVPVISKRNGLRAIVFGTGSLRRLKVPYLPMTADIRAGDILMSSGLGGVYPAGYPVAQVERVVSDPNEPFLTVIAKPLAHLNHHTNVLLLWPLAHVAGTWHG